MKEVKLMDWASPRVLYFCSRSDHHWIEEKEELIIVLVREKAAVGRAVASNQTLEHKEQAEDEDDDNCSEDEILVDECVHSLVH
jgi:hypothetical protein